MLPDVSGVGFLPPHKKFYSTGLSTKKRIQKHFVVKPFLSAEFWVLKNLKMIRGRIIKNS